MSSPLNRALVLLVSLMLSACGKSVGPTPTPTPTPNLANRAPVIGSLVFSPPGMGIDSATIFTFTAQVSDPDGDSLAYSWTSTEGAPAVSSTAALSRVFMRAGRFDVRVTVTDPKGESASATATVTIGNLTGTWDIACQHGPIPGYPAFPNSFVASMTQSGSNLFGTLSAAGQSQSFPAPANVTNSVSNQRRASFGVEAAFNRWAPRDSDFYFNLTANETLSSMSGTSQYCTSATATRR